MNRKRIAGLIVVGALCFSFVGCGAKEAAKQENTEKTVTDSALNADKNKKTAKKDDTKNTQESEMSEETEDSQTKPETISQDIAKDYVGEWMDCYSQRCKMKIASTDGVNYTIDINWGSSAWENTHWAFTGEYNADKHGIAYTGSRIEESSSQDADADAAPTETVTYSDGAGLLYLQDGLVYWTDDKENAGSECYFKRQ